MLGPGKIGKSGFWAEGEKTLFLDFEGGLKHLSVLSVPCRVWDELEAVRDSLYVLAREKKFEDQYDTIVVDTADKMVDRCNEHVLDLARIKFHKMADNIHTIGDVPEGQGWFMATTLMAQMMDSLKLLPAHLVLISHVATKEFVYGVRKVNKDTISIGGQMGTRMLHMVDHTLHVKASMNGSEIERVVRTKPIDTMEAGSRGNLVPDGFKWGLDAAENYARFRALFV